jgi:hypothetical protein
VRFFTSRGPARPHDFAWWAGLTVADARAGLARAGARLAEEVIDGTTYWSGPSAAADAPATTVHLLPNFDEYLMAYRDGDGATFPEGALDGHIVIVDGRIAGGWRRTIERRRVLIEATLLTDLDQAHGDALDAAARRYGDFVGMPVSVTRHLQPG